MYYKLKSIKDGFQVVGKVKKIGKPNDGFLYFTEEEMTLLNPDAVKGYDKKEPRENRGIYYYLNKP